MATTFTGLPAAPGIGIGTIYIYAPMPFAAIAEENNAPGTEHQAAHPYAADEEWQRFLDAQRAVDAELTQISQSAGALVADIFAGQRVILQDKTLSDFIKAALQQNGVSAAAATQLAIADLSNLFRSLDDDYFASRAADIVDIGYRLLAHLGGEPYKALRLPLSQLPPDSILVADMLMPSDMIQLTPDQVRGVAVAHSTPTAHIAILARGSGIPHVCALGAEIMALTTGTAAILDGNTGTLVAAPSAADVQHYVDIQHYRDAQQDAALQQALRPAITRDDCQIPVHANLSSLEDAAQIPASGADGIGLLRSEFIFLDRDQPPTAQEQIAIYSEIGQQLVTNRGGGQSPAPFTVRGLDIGGDKPVPYVRRSMEENPALGVRGIRLLFTQPDLLREQIRALWDMARDPNLPLEIRLLLPMVSTIDEVEAARAILRETVAASESAAGHNGASEDKATAGDPVPNSVQPRLHVGAMVEVPALALMADRLAAHVDFLSIGTNDLTQYVLACDRNNGAMADLSDALHPALLRLIDMICRAGRDADIPISLCGEVANDPEVVPLLLGLGVAELSVAPSAVPLVKQAVRKCNMIQCRQLAEQSLQCDSAHEVRQLMATH